MAIKNIIAGGIGFSPGSTKYIPTLGFDIGEPPAPAAPVVAAPVYFAPSNQASYALWIKNPQGQLLVVLDKFNRLEWSKSANDVGAMRVELEDIYPDSYFVRDSIIEIWRKIPGGRPYLELNTQWFVVKRRYVSSQEGSTIELLAQDGNRLLASRKIGYRTGTDQTGNRDGVATTAMRNIVLDNLGVNASHTDRFRTGLINSANFQVEADKALGESIDLRNLIGKTVLKVLRNIADQSTNLGTRVYFDVTTVSGNLLEFRTFKGYMGNDHGPDSGQEVVLSEKRGSLVNVVYTEDDTKAYNSVFVGGSGENTDRLIGTAEDTDSINESPFALRETWIEARGEDQTVIDAIAAEALERGKTKISVSAKIDDVGVRYGVDYGYGDRVTVGARGQDYTGYFEGIKGTIINNNEDIRALLRIEA